MVHDELSPAGEELWKSFLALDSVELKACGIRDGHYGQGAAGCGEGLELVCCCFFEREMFAVSFLELGGSYYLFLLC